jgi:hypothetical protein
MNTLIDLKKELKHLYKPSAKQPEIVDVPPMNFLMLDGSGDPNTSRDYQDGMEALYSTAYTLKFTFKKQRGIDYPVMALEGLWWVDDLSRFSYDDKSNWQWTMMMMQPDVVTEASLKEAVAQLKDKKDLRALPKIRLERYHEGLSAQIMHVGPFSEEPATIARLDGFIAENGYVMHKKHREIYLSDYRRTAPEKLKTIIRHPITKKS